VLVFVVIFILSIDVVFLTIQNKKLKSTIQTYIGNSVNPLKSGDQVKPLKVISMNGDTINFTYTETDKKYILFVLSTTCPHCEKNLIYWQNIIDSIDNNKLNIFGISLNNYDETLHYIMEKKLGFYTFTIADTNFIKEYKIAGVPETILLNGKGVVENVWIGELNNEKTMEIRKSINNYN